MPNVRPFLAALGFVLTLAACGERGAPEDRGVCWRMSRSPSGSVSFAPLARGIDSLENCAVLLEAVRLQGANEADGAYQGYYILAGPDRISSGLHTNGLRYPIFQPPQRAAIDRDLKRMIAEHGGKLPNAADISVERAH
ncbi:MAG TPA: hypothetical protein VMT68_05905 [Caulobacteraceae bacterium]|nr:hypothetical protein [Caulobacteraceae bacterium]